MPRTRHRREREGSRLRSWGFAFAFGGMPLTRVVWAGTLVSMGTPTSGWVTVASYENTPGRLHPKAAVRA